MFNLGFTEVIFLAVIALIFIGPKQLPDLARTLGRFITELKRTTNEIGQTIASPTNYVKDQFNKELNDINRSYHKKPGSNDDSTETAPAEQQQEFALDGNHQDEFHHDELHHDEHDHLEHQELSQSTKVDESKKNS